MAITYHSTRNSLLQYTASEAILRGISPDGGLFVPSTIPKLSFPLERTAQMTYQELAFLIMKDFLPDFTDNELQDCASVYDTRFDDRKITPLVYKDSIYFLELFHGPTIAFKDMALSILPRLMTTAASKNNVKNEIVILTATSGDTGKAAMVGFADVPQTKIIVFYPKNGVSEIQEKQMLTQQGDNISVVAIDGNFDDAQSKVKEMFADKTIADELEANGMQFSSANSINIGRLIPQIIYYFYAYGQMIQSEAIQSGDLINVTVPTGNFGNMLAAYYAKQMGLPIHKCIVASNENNVLTDFFQTGTYDRNRDFTLTSSPSMDILVSSNLERLLYMLLGEDTQKVKKYMNELSTEGRYQVAKQVMSEATDFYADFATEKEVLEQIKKTYKDTNYIIDPHTAVATVVANKYQDTSGDKIPMLVASTASPYKFPTAVLDAIVPNFKADSLEDSLAELKRNSNIPYPPAIEEALYSPVLHNTVITTEEMPDEVKRILGI
ncbi:threonine synthase [Jeotgalibaca sp. MA1X17-3]|uniref:threonine synthase n=1 Tax=Jeotgalibaca sp. MA1X17-3 TaxID=2908211 RepID=UPI001F473BE3|nr:threonine synthase [Jeotgalibaca sp. MA1X17-3]UJF16370.1 threonine synthase [Jeotgalibaca sp. MA1X17-3]